MPIIASYIVPHGALILNPQDPKSAKLNTAMQQISQEIHELAPDVVFLSTPHGIANSYDFCLYNNERASGTAEWLGDYKEYSVDVPLHTQIVDEIVVQINALVNNAVSSITAFSKGESIPLRWGEVIPLWFLQQNQWKQQFQYVIMSQPTRRYTQAKAMVTEMKRLGRNLWEYFRGRDEKIVVLISGDLSHCHDAEGPYGFSPDAEVFDTAMNAWVADPTSKSAFLILQNTIDTALSCGFTGFSMLFGMLEQYEGKLISQVLANEHPSYYGMLVARFLFK